MINYYESLSNNTKTAIKLLVIAVGADLLVFFAYVFFALEIYNFFDNISIAPMHFGYSLFYLLSFAFFILNIIGIIFGIIGAVRAIKERRLISHLIWIGGAFGLYLNYILWIIFVANTL